MMMDRKALLCKSFMDSAQRVYREKMARRKKIASLRNEVAREAIDRINRALEKQRIDM